MQFHSFISHLAVSLFYINAVTAASSSHRSVSSKCFTPLGVKQTKGLQTKWSTVSASCNAISTLTSTIAPSASTVTVTSTTTSVSTAPTSTSTATTTTVSTSTGTVTSTTTTTLTSTLSTDTSTLIPASAGFLPVASTVPGASNAQSLVTRLRRRNAKRYAKREYLSAGSKQNSCKKRYSPPPFDSSFNSSWPALPSAAPKGSSTSVSPYVQPTPSPSSVSTYTQSTPSPSGARSATLSRRNSNPSPSSSKSRTSSTASLGHSPQGDVVCYVYNEQCSTSTVTVYTTAAAETVTSASISTSVTTTTPGADTTSTITLTETTIQTDSATDTATTTTVVYTSTSSTYAACATNNFARYVNNLPVNGFAGNGSPLGSAASTEYDCCVAALTTPNVGLWAFVISTRSCLLANVGACTAGQASNGVGNLIQVDDDSDTPPVYIVGNAYCGQWDTVLTTG